MSLPLAGRTALVTGVSRRRGIGFAVASRLAEMGASLAVHHHRAHDSDEYGAADDLDRHWSPQNRLGEPDDPARLVAWLVSDEGQWVVGQVLNSEGGFRR